MTQNVLENIQLGKQKSLLDYSKEKKVMMVFLRHSGCTFCRETLGDLIRHEDQLEELGVQIVFVHMSEGFHEQKMKEKFPFKNAIWISDRNKSIYSQFGLKRGSLLELFGPKVIMEGYKAGIKKQHGVGKLDGDGMQMPGIFSIIDGETTWIHKYDHAGDTPNFKELIDTHF
ncbi:MAG: SelL-related redox protein [Bdellovibrionales bacterium]